MYYNLARHVVKVECKHRYKQFKRNRVVTLYLAGKSQSSIVCELKHINDNTVFVNRTITY